MAIQKTINLGLSKQDGNELVDPTVYGGNFEIIAQTFDRGNALSNGVSVVDRVHASGDISPASGDVVLIYFTNYRDIIAKDVEVRVGNNAASGLTLARIGIYEVSPINSDLTLIASTANSTTGFNQYSEVQRPLSSTVQLDIGKRYAVGVIFVGTTPPSVVKAACSSDYGLNGKPPRLCGKLTGQTDLPSTITDSSLSSTGEGVFVTITN